jgi:hypothetical protein
MRMIGTLGSASIETWQPLLVAFMMLLSRFLRADRASR